MSARLEIITGPMFSGKTEELLRRLRRHEIARRKVLLVKPFIDWRYSQARVVSHNGRSMDAVSLNEDEPHAMARLIDEASAYNVVGFDEAQFYLFLHEAVETLMDEGKTIIVAGLDMDFLGAPFGSMPTLMALADSVDKLTAICVRCGEEAGMSQRLTGDSATIHVGGASVYEARCRECHVA